MAVGVTSLQQEHTGAAFAGKSSGDDTAGGSATDHDVVEGLGHN